MLGQLVPGGFDALSLELGEKIDAQAFGILAFVAHS